MRIVFDWGIVNRLTVDIDEGESAGPAAFEHAARHIVDTCQKRDLDRIELQVIKTDIMRTLFEHHLCNMNFGRVQFTLDDGSSMDYELLVYKRNGWTLDPSFVPVEGKANDG